MFSRSNLSCWKTTILGLLIMAASLAYVFIVEGASVWIFGILLVLGISLIFLPNTLVDSLTNLLKANSNKKF